MSFPKVRFVRISAFILVGFLFFIPLLILILSNLILPGEIHRYIEESSRDAGYEVKFSKIRFNFFSGLIVDGLEVFDLINHANPILRVKNIAVRPGIMSSLIGRKVKIREVIIDNSVVYLTPERFNNVVELIKKKPEKSKEKEKTIPFEIERLTITNVQVGAVSQIPIRVKKIEVDLRHTGLDEKGSIDLSGLIDIKNNQVEIQGDIKPFSDTPIGELKINIHQLNMHSFSNISFLPEEIGVFLDSRFRISGKMIMSQGVIDFRPTQSQNKEDSNFLGKINYDLTYDSLKDTAFVNSLDLDLSGLTHASFIGNIERLTKGAIFDIKGKAKTIRLEDVPKWFPNLSHIEFFGAVKPDGLKITGSIRDRNIYLTGNVFLRGINVSDRSSGLRFSGLKGSFNFKQKFVGPGSGVFLAQGDSSLMRFKIGTLNLVGISGNVRFDFSEDGIRFTTKGLSYGDLSFNRATVKRGRVTRLEFDLGKDNYWTLNMDSYGSQFNILDEGIYMKEFQTNIHIQKNRKIDIWGRLDGKGGRYKDISFLVSTDFKFRDDLLKFTNLNVVIEDYGELKTERLNLIFGDQKTYILTFTQGNFYGFDKEVISKGIRGKFMFNAHDDKELVWDGNVFISEINIFESRLKDMSFHMNLNRNRIDLKKISGRFLGGSLEGNIQIKTAESPTFISSEIELRNINLDRTISLGLLNFRFRGEFKRWRLPQGSGEVTAILNLGRYSTVNSLGCHIEIKTNGETVFLKEGFIEDGRSVAVRFSGKMENPLDSTRRLRFDLPETPLASIYEILSPILPESLRGGEIRGNTSLSLSFVIPPKRGMFWDGKLSLKDASFNGNLSSDVHFLVRDMNGTIHLVEDEGNLENHLNFSIIGYSKPDEKMFETSLNALAQDKAEHGDDILRIGEIEYGFLRLEDIEFVLEVSRDKINLKRFQSTLYGGKVLGTGLFEFGGEGEERKYDFSFLFKDLSLRMASDSIPSTRDYITGRINGIGWLSNRGGKLSTLDGAFNFWAVKSKREPRTIGKALLTQLGVREKFLLRSSRKYDKGQFYGYIRGGVITFKELEISHSILGINDLLIRVDSKRNSISVAHLLSVIRETARRASEGRLKIEFENK